MKNLMSEQLSSKNANIETAVQENERKRKVISWLGTTLISLGVKELVENSGSNEQLAVFFYRHASGDWGSVSKADWEANNIARDNAERVMSVYMLGGVKIWIITEADRSKTIALLPDEY